MPRIRTIKPDAFTSHSLTSVTVHARWTFAGLWTYFDDEGRGRADVRLIKAAVWPLDDDVTAEMIVSYLDELEREYAICRYEVDGREYLHATNWQHQRINRKTPSKLPECPRIIHGGLSEDSVRTHDNDSEGSRRTHPGKGREGNRDSATRSEPQADSDADETVNQRANRLARTYTDRRKLSNFPAVAGVVRKAIGAGYDDPSVIAALTRLAEDNRSVTADSLRYELEGLPPSQFARPSRPEPERPGFWNATDRNAS